MEPLEKKKDVHSKKGREILEKIRNNIIIKKMNIDKSWEENPSVIYSSELHTQFGLFYERINRGDEFENVVHDILDVKDKKKIVKKLRSFFHKIKSV